MRSIAKKFKARASRRKGTLIIIGGREDKEKDMEILKEIANQTGKAKLVIATIASRVSEEVWHDYKKIFADLGVKNTVHFTIERSEEARDQKNLALFDNVKTIFFTGGDQLKITTKLGGSPILEKIMEIYHTGGVIAGTSAGAAIMGKTMLVGSENAESHKVGNWMMAPGIGFVEDIIVDQHFAQRGRIGRLLGAVALNPGILGIGIDEDTAIIIKDGNFKVIGSNAVYVVDGQKISSTNISEAAAEKTMSMHHVQLHILANSEKFNLKSRKPSR
ncbi:MAG: cyanophycinase [Bdellovibrionaceae bacterium]|nr:cyanophycinase [Bdellovibrio sp.]